MCNVFVSELNTDRYCSKCVYKTKGHFGHFLTAHQLDTLQGVMEQSAGAKVSC